MPFCACRHGVSAPSPPTFPPMFPRNVRLAASAPAGRHAIAAIPVPSLRCGLITMPSYLYAIISMPALTKKPIARTLHLSLSLAPSRPYLRQISASLPTLSPRPNRTPRLPLYSPLLQLYCSLPLRSTGKALWPHAHRARIVLAPVLACRISRAAPPTASLSGSAVSPPVFACRPQLLSLSLCVATYYT